MSIKTAIGEALWNVFGRDDTDNCLGTLAAETKDKAQRRAEKIHNRPVDVDLCRGECNPPCGKPKNGKRETEY